MERWGEGLVGSLSFNVQGWEGGLARFGPIRTDRKRGEGVVQKLDIFLRCKTWTFFFDVINVWSLTPGDPKNSNSRKGLALSSHIKNQNHYF